MKKKKLAENRAEDRKTWEKLTIDDVELDQEDIDKLTLLDANTVIEEYMDKYVAYDLERCVCVCVCMCVCVYVYL